MLSDSQIDRYSRQILLPEVGSRGQERLLGAAVAIRGGGAAAVACASYLSGAGVGRLWLGEIGAVGAAGRALAGGRCDPVAAIRDRNPDCRLLDVRPEAPSVVVSAAPAPPPATGAPLLWGGASAEGIACLSVPQRGCLECARAAAAAEGCRGASALVGTVLALEALRVLLGFAAGEGPSLLRLDLSRFEAVRRPLPRRARCGACATRASAATLD